MDKNKMAIAVAAVSMYIKTQEEQDAMLMRPLRPEPQVNKPWAIAGRQAMMQLSDLMQMKAFHTKLK